MENQNQPNPTQQILNSYNSLFQGLNKANQKGVFQLSESNALFQSLLVLKKYLEKTLNVQQTPETIENVTIEVKKE